MKYFEFEIGSDFRMSGKTYRCTDIGKRTVVAIRIDAARVTKMNLAGGKATRTLTGVEALAEGWFNGPPYPVVEKVFDENDQELCTC